MHPAKVCRFASASGAVLTIVLCGTTGTSGDATATSITPIPKVEVLEWDLKEQMDSRPGAIAVDLTGDGNRLWFVTREGSRLYRVDFRGGKKVNNAQWFSWQLDPFNTGIANGLRKVKTSGDKRFVFVDSTTSLQRIDTAGCTTPLTPCRTTWNYEPTIDAGVVNPFHGSDVAIDEYNSTVYTAVGASDPTRSFIQRLDSSPADAPNNVTRWFVGNNAGFCPGSIESPCLSGITIDRRSRDLVYYSEPGDGGPNAGAIAELNTRYSTVRRWFIADLAAKTGDSSISEPRQLQFDNDGTLWAVTGSGHLVSLDPKKNRMSKHLMPTQDAFKDPFGVSPDGGLIGYTDPAQDQPRVGMLQPARKFVTVTPVGAMVDNEMLTIQGITLPADTSAGNTPPKRQTVPGQIARNPDGTFSEALTSPVYTTPLGITPDRSASSGTFFFAVGDPADIALGINRIARVRLPRGEMKGRVERDDDDTDDDGKRADVDDDVDDDGIPNAFDADNDNDGIPDLSDDDDDNDGIEDSFDTKDKKESKQTSQQDLAAGQTGEDPFTLNPNMLLAVASAVSTDLLALVKVEIVDAAGNVVVSSLSTPGAATVTFIPPAAGGNYTLRVKNSSLTAASITTKLLTRELWPVVALPIPIGI